MKSYISITILVLLALVTAVNAQYVTGQIPDLGNKVLLYQAPSTGNGTTTLGFPELISTGMLGSTPNYIGKFIMVIHDAGGAGAAPQTEYREITGFSSTSGVITVSPAFTALAAGDKCYIFTSAELHLLENIQGDPATSARFLSVTTGAQSVDSTWSSVATHEVFDVTGDIEFWMAVYDSVDYTGADSIVIQIDANKISAVSKANWDAGELISYPSILSAVYYVENPTIANCGAFNPGIAGAKMFHGFSRGLDIGYAIQTSSAPAGISRWLIWWRPLSSNGAVAAGLGGSL